MNSKDLHSHEHQHDHTHEHLHQHDGVEHKHEHCHSHVHEHNHEHCHNHEHTCGEGHEHAHSDKDHIHDHHHEDLHRHNHNHEHSHEISSDTENCGQSKDERTLKILLDHWIDHNKSHEDGFREWVEKAKSMEKPETADFIQRAIEAMQQADKMLEEAKKHM